MVIGCCGRILLLRSIRGASLNVFHHLPVGLDETLQICEWYFPNETATEEEQQVIEFVDQVRNEDIPSIAKPFKRDYTARAIRKGDLTHIEIETGSASMACMIFRRRTCRLSAPGETLPAIVWRSTWVISFPDLKPGK